jgi:hypothetical protein
VNLRSVAEDRPATADLVECQCVLDELIGQPVGRIRDDALDPVRRTPLKQEVAARAGLSPRRQRLPEVVLVGT